MTHPVAKYLSVTLGLLLAACAAPTEPVPPVAEATPPPEVETTQSAQIPEPDALFPTPAEPEPIAVDMARLDGQAPTGVVAYLGTPSLVRRDDSVQVMIFEASSCVVEVIFYEPANGDHFRAHRVNARSRTGQDVDTENCIRQHLESQQ